jgi:hypothetical protein
MERPPSRPLKDAEYDSVGHWGFNKERAEKLPMLVGRCFERGLQRLEPGLVSCILGFSEGEDVHFYIDEVCVVDAKTGWIEQDLITALGQFVYLGSCSIYMDPQPMIINAGHRNGHFFNSRPNQTSIVLDLLLEKWRESIHQADHHQADHHQAEHVHRNIFQIHQHGTRRETPTVDTCPSGIHFSNACHCFPPLIPVGKPYFDHC